MAKHAETNWNVFTTRQSQDLECFAMTAEALRSNQTSLTVYLLDDAAWNPRKLESRCHAITFMVTGKGKAIPLQAWTGPWGFQEVEDPRFHDSQHMKAVRLSALRTGLLYPQEIFLVLISVRGWVDPHDHNAAGRIMSMKTSNDTIGNRTCALPTCSAVPQPTAPPRAPHIHGNLRKIFKYT
jgi:hypothetical protein